MALAGLIAGASKRDALVERAIIADDGGLTDDDTHGVVDEESAADLGAWVNFHTCHEASELRRYAREAL